MFGVNKMIFFRLLKINRILKHSNRIYFNTKLNAFQMTSGQNNALSLRTLCFLDKLLSIYSESESNMTYGQVWWPILGIRALHLPIQGACTQQSTHTHTHTHTHTVNTNLEQWALEGDTRVDSQTSPVPLPQKLISSRPNPTKKLGENPVPSTPGKMTPIPSHSRVGFFFLRRNLSVTVKP